MTITGICSLNLTLVGVNIYFNEFLVIDVKERRVKGMLEGAWNYILGREKRCIFSCKVHSTATCIRLFFVNESFEMIKFSFSRCRLVVVETYEASANKSIKSALGFFADKSADVFLVWQTLNVDSDLGEYSHAASHET